MPCENPGERCCGSEQGGGGGGGENQSYSGSILNREPTESADELEVGCEGIKRDQGWLDSFRKTVCAPCQTLPPHSERHKQEVLPPGRF